MKNQRWKVLNYSSDNYSDDLSDKDSLAPSSVVRTTRKSTRTSARTSARDSLQNSAGNSRYSSQLSRNSTRKLLKQKHFDPFWFISDTFLIHFFTNFSLFSIPCDIVEIKCWSISIYFLHFWYIQIFFDPFWSLLIPFRCILIHFRTIFEFFYSHFDPFLKQLFLARFLNDLSYFWSIFEIVKLKFFIHFWDRKIKIWWNFDPFWLKIPTVHIKLDNDVKVGCEKVWKEEVMDPFVYLALSNLS